MMTKWPEIWRAMLLFVMVTSMGTALAQHADYPARPVRMIVPFAAAGATDIFARVLAASMFTGSTNASIVVENRAGAAGNVGMDAIAKAAGDGYTIGVVSRSTMAINPALYPSLPFDTKSDFVPVALVATQASVLVVNATVPVRSLDELLKLAKVHVGKLNYGSAGAGNTQHLQMELLKKLAGVDIVHVPYRGGAPAVTDLLGGRIELLFTPTSAVLPHLQSGRLRAIAVASDKRDPLLPEVPTFTELGYAGFDSGVWFGIVAPKGTPPAIIERLYTELRQAVATRTVKARFAELGFEPAIVAPIPFTKQIATEYAVWGNLIRDIGVKPD